MPRKPYVDPKLMPMTMSEELEDMKRPTDNAVTVGNVRRAFEKAGLPLYVAKTDETPGASGWSVSMNWANVEVTFTDADGNNPNPFPRGFEDQDSRLDSVLKNEGWVSESVRFESIVAGRHPAQLIRRRLWR